MATFPLSQLPSYVQEWHADSSHTGMVTVVKYLRFADFWRKTAVLFRDIDDMLADGWFVIDATK